ncbi:hypothetical protein [Streptomyces sp. NPDC059080]|uniref:hypothetical protein n=1 Tax=Streptomyces sp. NPDC059080 TaxID=3346718 RepID=UPI0036959A95
MPKPAFNLANIAAPLPSLATDLLTDGLRAAGIPAEASISADGEITLSRLTLDDVQLLANRLHDGLVSVVEELCVALTAHGIRTRPVVEYGRVRLGEWSLAQVDALALALGAPAQPGLVDTDYPGWPEAHDVCRRLEAASKDAIGHGIRGDLIPYCVGCDRDAGLRYLPLEPDVVRRLTGALIRRAKPAGGDA